MSVKFSNNGHSTLAASLTNSATSITVASGHGARFPSLSGSEYFYATLIDSSNNLEIVKVTARSSDVLTVTRAQESTTARAYAIGDRIELRVTAAGLVDATALDAVVADNSITAAKINVSGNGSAGQYLESDGDGSMTWSTVSSGTYSVHRIDSYSHASATNHSSGGSNYIDIAGGNTVNFTPTHANDFIFFTHYCRLNWGNYAQGADVYLMMKASSASIGSGDTKLNYNGQHATYTNTVTDIYMQVSKQIMVPCTNLTVGTTYYVEQAGAVHTGNGTMSFGGTATNASGYINGMHRHHVTMTHYKKN